MALGGFQAFKVFQVIRQQSGIAFLSNTLGKKIHRRYLFCIRIPSQSQPLTFKAASMSSDKGESETPVQSRSESDGAKQPMRYATRGNILTEQRKHVETAIDEIRSLSIDQKRKKYLCRNRYTELTDVQTWPEYFEDNLADNAVAQNWWKRNNDKVKEEINPDLNKKISIFKGDITTLEIDAIVNAANESLLGGGGVDGAIHRAAGRDLLMECELLNGCSAGDAKITCGYKLPAKHVIHTVGPRGEYPAKLESCYKTCLDLMKENYLTTAAFPCISTGIFGYPNANAAKVVLNTVRQWLNTEDYAKKVDRIIFCLFLDKDVDIYNELLQLYFPLERSESE